MIDLTTRELQLPTRRHHIQDTPFCLAVLRVDAIAMPQKPVWRNWQTRTTQNRVPKRSVGSTPTTGTIQVIDGHDQRYRCAHGRLFGCRQAGSGSCRGIDHCRGWAAYDLWIFFLRVRTRLSTVSALPGSAQRLLRQRTARGAALSRCQPWRFAQGNDCRLCRYHRRHALEYRTVRLSRRCRMEILAGPE